MFVLGIQISIFGQKLARLERGKAGINDDIVLEVEDAFDILERHVEQQTNPARQRFQEPDMGDWGGKLDMAHTLSADLAQRYLDTAFFAYNAAILHPLVFTAQTLVILDWPEYSRAKQAVPFRLEGAVIDGLRLFDLAERPGPDAFRAGDRYADLIKRLVRADLTKDIHQFIH